MTESNGSTTTLNDKLKALYGAVVDLGTEVEAQLAPTSKEAFLKTLEIPETLATLSGTIETIGIMARTRIECEANLQAARKSAEEAKNLTLLSGIGEGGLINGKNEQIRNAQLADLLGHDPDYQGAQSSIARWEKQIAETDAELSRLRATETALKYKARLAAATLEYLAG